MLLSKLVGIEKGNDQIEFLEQKFAEVEYAGGEVDQEWRQKYDRNSQKTHRRISGQQEENREVSKRPPYYGNSYGCNRLWNEIRAENCFIGA